MWECNVVLAIVIYQKINNAFIYKPIPNKIQEFFLTNDFLNVTVLFIILKF